MTDQSTTITVQKAVRPPIAAGAPIQGIVPKDYDEAVRIAQGVYLSGTYPDYFRSPDEKVTAAKIVGCILRGAEIGVPPYYALAHIIIVNGRYSIDGETAVAVAFSKGVLADIKIEYSGEEFSDDWKCVYTAYRRMPDGIKPFVGEFSYKEAKRAKLLGKDNWLKYPQRMILARARAFALREGFADCLAGIAIVEEQQDLPAPPKPVDTTFLTDETDTGTPAPTDALQSGSTPATADTAPEKSEPLARGLGLLARQDDLQDVNDLSETIRSELANASEIAVWEKSVSERRKEIEG